MLTRIVRPVLKAGFRSLKWRLSRAGWLRPGLHIVYEWSIRRRSWMRAHPFDVAHGVDTAGYVPWWLLGAAGHSSEDNLGYGGCQPSCLRRALSTIADPARYAFLDLGCGKGRGLILASELPFRAIVGVEIDTRLSRVGRENAAAMRRRFPHRTPIEVREGDARQVDIPDGDLVVFIYHAFDLALLRSVVERLMALHGSGSLFVIYQNPVFSHVLDAQPGLRRWFAETVPREQPERGVGSDGDETVVAWVSRSHPAASWPGAETAIATLCSSGKPGAA